MRRRVVVVLPALLALAAAELGAQETLPAFRSDRELTRFLANLQDPPPRRGSGPPVPQQPLPIVTALPAGVHDGPAAERPFVLTGRVTNAQGQPEAAVLVRIESKNLGAATGADGTYRLVVPRARLQPGEMVTVTASRVGLSSLTRTYAPEPGKQITQDIVLATASLHLEDIVVTGTGAAESVTNNQHEGVDEGGIVKVHGDFLVMLRRGRLFTVDVGGGRLRPVDAVDAYGDVVDPDGTWYDELLVSDGNVVVIGYSYARGGTEVGLFSIDGAGRLAHRSTYHLRSDDYYSSRNYASRLTGGKLVLYAPVPVDGGEDLAAWMPAVRRWHDGAKAEAFRRTLRPTRIYRADRPMARGDAAVLHTVTTCGLTGGELDCESSAVLGPGGRVFYVSPTAVYVWVSDWAGEPGRRAASVLYRMPLDGAAPTALGVEGAPTDQFSFLESDDGHVNVLVRAEGRGDGMWAAELAAGSVWLLRVPVSRFGDGGRMAPRRAYRALPLDDDGHGAFHNRFVGRHVLYGSGSGWGAPEAGGATLYAARWPDGRVSRVALPHGIDRIEGMGGDAVVVGADTADLHFTGIRLDGTPRVAQRYVQRQAQQGELRSHGFFYRAEGRDAGVLGLPVRRPGRPGYEHLFEESASILFLRSAGDEFRALGELQARDEGAVEDACVASCVDWYGNARPLFLRGRTFALLGYEIVEGAVDDGRLREVRRVSFTPSPAQARN